MEQKYLSILIVILLIPWVIGININEVELNPTGDDSGNEWVELYTDTEINLDGWKLVNNDGDEIILNQSFSDYLIINFEKQWLDNTDEKVFLYEDDNLIDETDILDDSKNNNLAWSFCQDWKFIEATKGSKNLCENDGAEENSDKKVENKSVEQETQREEETKSSEESLKKEDETETLTVQKNEIIKLNSFNEENSKVYKSKNEYIKEYSIYGFIILLVLMIVLLIIKKTIKIKNE